MESKGEEDHQVNGVENENDVPPLVNSSTQLPDEADTNPDAPRSEQGKR